ncbi:MAG: polysaccharide biosynthesis tyrosine autokinase [Fimbriimonadaceae bacterium]
MQPTNRVKRDLSLRDVLTVIGRQRLTIAVIFVICLAAGAVAFRMTKAVFRSTMRILIERRTAATNPDSAEGRIGTPSVNLSIPTQIQILGSGDMTAQLGYSNEYDPYTPIIQAKQVEDTDVLSVSVDAADPDTAQRVANELGPKYNTYLTGLQTFELDRAFTHLTDTLQTEEADYNRAVATLQSAKAHRKLPYLSGEDSIRAGRVVQTQNALVARETDVAVAEKNLATFEAQQKALPKSRQNLSISPNIAEIESQKALLAGLEAQRASLLTQWKEGTPKILEIDAEIKDQQQRLAEIPKIVNNTNKTDDPLRNSLESQVAGARAALAAANVEKAKAETAASKALADLKLFSAVQPKETDYGNEITVARNRLLDTQQTIKVLRLRESQTADPIRVIAQPSVAKKIRPILTQYVVVAVLTGLILSVGVALLKDYLEDKVTSPDDVFQLCGLEPLAQMPRMASLTGPVSASNAIERHEPAAELFDSYRLLRFSLLNAAERGYMGSLVVTSATGSEGKSDLAADLASVMASSGRKVILVDANLRNPTVAARFGLAERPGMTDVLIGEAPLEAALVPTNIEGLSVLPAGARTSNPVDLLESPQMVSMHASLRELADLVIFDAPSCLAFADVSVLASFTDSVLVVAELGTTKRELLSRGVNLLQRSSARLVGVVLRDHQSGRKKSRRRAAA